jgi:hypothetical protein
LPAPQRGLYEYLMPSFLGEDFFSLPQATAP